MCKNIIFATSCYNKKFYFNPITSSLPESIKQELKKFGVFIAEKVHCIVIFGFYANGDFFIETNSYENDFEYDEIGASLEVEKMKREEKEFIKSLQLWYKVFLAQKNNFYKEV